MSKELQERLIRAEGELLVRQRQVDRNRAVGPTLEECMAYVSLEIQLEQLEVACQSRYWLGVLAGEGPK